MVYFVLLTSKPTIQLTRRLIDQLTDQLTNPPTDQLAVGMKFSI